MFDARDVLLKAAERISEEGMWCRGLWYKEEGLTQDQLDEAGFTAPSSVGILAVGVHRLGVRLPECAQGAIASSIVELVGHFDDILYNKAESKLYETLNYSVPQFNDAPGRTASEVAEAMRAAAS